MNFITTGMVDVLIFFLVSASTADTRLQGIQRAWMGRVI